MQAEHSGRLSLTMDATYCAVVGGLLTVTRRRAGRLIGLPPAAVAAAGAATVVWAGLVQRLSTQPEWRRGVAMVATANVFAAFGIGAAAVRQRTRAGGLVLAAVATDVATFAVWQAVALRTATTDSLVRSPKG